VGLALLAATLPMLALPTLGSRLAPRWGWRRFFALALAALAVGGAALVGAALADDARVALVLAVLGMVGIGSGAALSHPQLSGAVVALAPPDAAGMASAVTIVARQGGFSIGIAALGAAASPGLGPVGFAAPFALAAAASALGLAACALLPQRASGSRTRR
jgi:MFS family permease